MNAARSPVGRALFAEWQRVRGGPGTPGTRPFSRHWEELLETAGLQSAIERGDADRDARELAAAGWVRLGTVRYRPERIERISIPLAAEADWCAAFGFVPPSDEEARRLREFDWEPALAFVRDARLNLPFEELRRLDDFLRQGGRDREVVPIKERSLELFGDEKRLDELLGSALFREGRLDPCRDLRCESIGVPLAWRRGPAAAGDQPLLVIENAATWHSYARWNALRALFSGVVYGDGNRFIEGARYLTDVFTELGGTRRVLYFGDLDAPGLHIPLKASRCLQDAGGPPVEPHLWSYRQLLAVAGNLGPPGGSVPVPEGICEWLGAYAEPARRLFAAGRRLAQEHIGWEYLRSRTGLEPDA